MGRETEKAMFISLLTSGELKNTHTKKRTVYETWKTWKHFYTYRKWQDYVYIQCEYKSTKQKIKHLLREENKVKENKIS